MKFKIGDIVDFVDAIGGGKVVAVRAGIFTVQDEHGFAHEMLENQIVSSNTIDFAASFFVGQNPKEKQRPSRFKIGSHIKFVDSVGGGEIVSIDGDVFSVEDEHGFSYEMQASQIVLDETLNYHSAVDFTQTEGQDDGIFGDSNETHPHHQPGKIDFLEVDLHIHHLVSNDRNLSNHEMVKIQLNYVKKMLAEAKNGKYQKLIFIHGVGAGTLKGELLHYLAQVSNCECRDASFQDYGYGATEVRIWYN